MANELIRLVRLRSSQSEDSAPVALFMVIRRNLRRYGGMLIHFGAVLIFLGVAGKFFSLERDMTLSKDQAQTIGSYQLVFRGVSEIPVENAIHRAAKIEVLDLDGKRLQFLNPAKSFYPTQPQPLTEVGIRRSFWEDLYLIFSSENEESGDSVTPVSYTHLTLPTPPYV